MDKDPNIRLPSVDSGMNKIAPTAQAGGKGGENDPPKLDQKEKDKLLDRIRKRFDRCVSAESENRLNALKARKFKAGDQWPADVQAQRNFEKRPCLTINKLPTFINQVVNDQRQNRPAINVSPVGDRSDPEVAKMYRGLIRFLERESHADIAYDTAFDDAVTSGFGFWRTLTEYDGPQTFDQTITVKRIRNPFTVYGDPDGQEPDGADWRYAFITEMVPRDDFKEQWPKADVMPFTQSGIGEAMKHWVTKDTIRIAEYFEIVHEKRTLVALSNGHVGWEDELGDDAVGMLSSGRLKVLRTRDSFEPKVKWYKVTAKDVLESKDWPGRWIPIVRVIGNELDIEGKVKLTGLIHNSMDAQRMYNYWKTSETELIALAPKAPYIMEEGQLEGHEKEWKQANTKSYPYLLYKGTNVNNTPAPPPQRQPFAGVPMGVVQAAQGAAQDMMATTGIRFDATMNERMIDESGRAIRELRRSGDIGAFHYVDNLSRALKHQGDIFVDLIPKVYDTRRVMTILREDDSEEQVVIDPDAPKPYQEAQQPAGKKLKIFNPKVGRYGVTVTIGPSYATKRIEAAESMMDFARALPNTAALIADLIAKNQDWPGAQEMAARLAKALPPQLLTPDQKDVPPQIQAVMQQMDMQIKQLGMERQQLIAALHEKMTDRAMAADKINKDFEAKLMAIIQKAEAASQSHEANRGSQLKDMAEGVKTLSEMLHPQEPSDHGSQPAAKD